MHHVLTLIAPASTPTLGARAGLVNRLRAWLDPVRVVPLSPHACDLLLERKPPSTLWHEIRHWLDAQQIDAVLQPVATREKRLLVADMDSTMIAQECIDELAARIGIEPQVAAITERAMRGELDFAAALRERVALLKGLSLKDLEATYRERITLMSGAKTLLATMKARGAKTLLVSGGFSFFTSRVAKALGFDAEESNKLRLAGDVLTGEVEEPILGKEAKRESLVRAADAHHIPLAATLAVGDGANDVPMLLSAGLGVAYHAKPLVEAAAPAAIRHNDLTALLYMQGIQKTEWIEFS